MPAESDRRIAGQRSRKEFLRKQRIPSFSSFFNFHRHVTPVDSEIVGKLLALQRNLKGRGTAQLCLSGEVGKQLFSDGSFRHQICLPGYDCIFFPR